MKKGFGHIFLLTTLGVLLVAGSIFWVQTKNSDPIDTDPIALEEATQEPIVEEEVFVNPPSPSITPNEIRLIEAPSLTVRPGEKMVFYFSVPSETKSLMIVGKGVFGEGIRQNDASDGSPVYRVEVTIPQGVAGQLEMAPIAFVNTSAENPIGQIQGETIRVLIDTQGLTIESIKLINSIPMDGYDGLTLLLPNEERSYRVVGLFSDGEERDIAGASAGTTYSSQPDIIKIRTSDNTLWLTGLQDGTSGTLVISNPLASREYRFLVEIEGWGE